MLEDAVTLAWKIVLSAALPVVVLVVAAEPSLRALDDAGAGTRRALQRVAPVIREAAAVDETLAGLSRIHGRWSAMPDPAYAELWSVRMARVEQHSSALADLLDTPAERRLLAKAEGALDRYRELTASGRDGRPNPRHVSPGERDEALRANARARRSFLSIGRALETTAWHAEAEAAAVGQRTRATLRGAAVLAVLLALLLSALTARRILRGLRHLTWASEALERGRLDEPLAIGGRDEIARLATALETVAHGLRERDGVWDDMVQRLGRDLAEPLRAIRETTHVLADELHATDASRQRRLVAFIADATDHLLSRLRHIDEARGTRGESSGPAPLPIAFESPSLLLADPGPVAEDAS